MSFESRTELQNNKSKYYFYMYSKMSFHLGLPNFWHEDIDVPNYVKIILENVSKLSRVLLWTLFAAQFGSFFTQPNLQGYQKYLRDLFGVLQPFVNAYVDIMSYQVEKVRVIFYMLTVKLKDSYNDKAVESHMIKLITSYCIVFLFTAVVAITIVGALGLNEVYTSGGTFVTIVTVWPDVKDSSFAAGVVRVITYLVWIVFVIRVVFGAFLLVTLMLICLSHQYTNLCSYFHSLNDIFREEMLSQEEKEVKYEQAFKDGIAFHLYTEMCTRLTQETCYIVFSLQMSVCVSALIMLLLQLANSDRSAINTAFILVFISAMLSSTGMFCWNAGDVTVEASKLPTAMFSSGWQNCRKESMRRIRPMLLGSMWQSQRPIEFRCLGIVKLSYESYARMVRMSYSIFSVIY